MLHLEINDSEVEAALRQRSRELNADVETVLIRAAAENLGLPTVVRRYTALLSSTDMPSMVSA